MSRIFNPPHPGELLKEVETGWEKRASKHMDPR